MIWAHALPPGKSVFGQYMTAVALTQRRQVHVDMRPFRSMELDYRTLELHILRTCYGVDIGYGTVVNLPDRLAVSSEATIAAVMLTDGLPKSSSASEAHARLRDDPSTSPRAAKVLAARHDISTFMHCVLADERHHVR